MTTFNFSASGQYVGDDADEREQKLCDDFAQFLRDHGGDGAELFSADFNGGSVGYVDWKQVQREEQNPPDVPPDVEGPPVEPAPPANPDDVEVVHVEAPTEPNQ